MKNADISLYRHTTQADPRLALLEHLLRREPELEFAVLVGSRAQGTAHKDSDWDIALQC